MGKGQGILPSSEKHSASVLDLGVIIHETINPHVNIEDILHYDVVKVKYCCSLQYVLLLMFCVMPSTLSHLPYGTVPEVALSCIAEE